MQIPRFGLIIIGDEILSGKRADKHLHRFIEILSARGLSLAWAQYLGDDPQSITEALRRVFASSEVVFSCGGIGATPDDHTRLCAAQALDQPLLPHPQAQRLIRERMADLAREQGVPYEPHRPDNVHRLNMGVFPRGADIIPNPYNKIPGFACGGAAHGVPGRIHFLPGFPVMAWPMAEWVLDTTYAACFGLQDVLELSVILPGAMESTLTPLMQSIERDHPQIKVFSLPSVDHPEWGRHIELGVKGAEQAARQAYVDLHAALVSMGASVGTELVRNPSMHQNSSK